MSSVSPDSNPGLPTRWGLIGLLVAVIAVVLVFVVLDRVGTPDRTIMLSALLAFASGCLAIGLANRTMRLVDFYLAGRGVPSVQNGLAGAATWTSGTIYFSLTGLLYTHGYDATAITTGSVGGLVLIGIFIAPYLRKFGGYTLADFFAFRYDDSARSIVIAFTLIAALPLLLAHLQLMADVVGMLVPVSPTVALLGSLALTLSCTLFGGMKSVTATQLFLAVFLFAGLALPLVWLSGSAVQIISLPNDIAAALADLFILEAVSAADGTFTGLTRFVEPGHLFDNFNYLATVATFACGVASMPFLLNRFSAARSVQAARRSIGWSLVFAALILLMVLSYAVIARVDVFRDLLGHQLTTRQEMLGWAFSSTNGLARSLATICGQPAIDFAGAILACGGPSHVLTSSDILIDQTYLPVVVPLMAELPYPVIVILLLGGLAALLAATSLLLLSVANTLSHDIIFRSIDRRAPASRRLVLSRMMLVVIAGISFLVALRQPLGSVCCLDGDPQSHRGWNLSSVGDGDLVAAHLRHRCRMGACF